MTIGRRLNEFRLALMMLTRLPVGALRDPAPTPAEACWAYPFVGIPVAVTAWAMQSAGVGLGLTPLVSAFIAMLAMVLITGAMHHDGLADFVDGIGGGRDKAHRLEIMRDSRIGSYGVVALILAMGCQAAAMAGFEGGAPPLSAFLATAVGSRLAMLALLVSMPPARVDGLGRMTSSRRPTMLLPGVLLAVIAVAFGGLSSLVCVVIIMALIALIIRRTALSRIGGQTGDVLGATQLVAEVFGWIVISAAA